MNTPLALFPAQHRAAQPASPTSMSSSMDQVREVSRRVVRYTIFFSLLTSILGLAGLACMLAYLRFVIPSQDVGNIPAVASAGLGALAALAVFEVIRSRIMIRHGLFMHRTLADDVLSGMLEDAARQGKRGFSSAMADLGKLRGFVSSPQVFTFFDCLVAPVFLLAVFFISPVMGFVVLLAMALIGAITIGIRRRIAGVTASTSGSNQQNDAFLKEALRCRDAVTSMGMDAAVEERWRTSRQRSITAQTRADDGISGWTALAKFITVATPVLVVAIAAWLIINDKMDVFALIVVKVLSLRAIMPVHGVANNWGSLQQARDAYVALKELLTDTADHPKGMDLPPPSGELRADQITYTIQGQTLVRTVSLDLAPGEFLGVLGPMAAGKTTLARLLTGVLRPVMGKVSLDKADMFHWGQTKLGRHIGYLPQEVDLFPGTIAENIARLDPPDPAELQRVLTLVRLDEVLQRLPRGLDTVVRASDATLPGSLRQKIGLARALYGRPCLVVLDEPDANLDQAGTQDLLATLADIKSAAATIVMITHKPDLLDQADKLLVMNDGRAVHYGPKKQVLAKLQAAAGQGPVRVKL
ncbi:MAG: ATP-binding cassette domain-containing protein [Desulfovibrionales bacterium]|nr:MAG: ATP-binding cassette domain-containing protein [Desulfovibrionales bacterium]